jgi:hypothetical protein
MADHQRKKGSKELHDAHGSGRKASISQLDDPPSVFVQIQDLINTHLGPGQYLPATEPALDSESGSESKVGSDSDLISAAKTRKRDPTDVIKYERDIMVNGVACDAYTYTDGRPFLDFAVSLFRNSLCSSSPIILVWVLSYMY